MCMVQKILYKGANEKCSVVYNFVFFFINVTVKYNNILSFIGMHCSTVHTDPCGATGPPIGRLLIWRRTICFTGLEKI